MKRLLYESWAIEYDDDLTKQVFANMTGGPQTCGCGNCKNFMLARDRVYPENFRKMLSRLGIDYTKETEICHFNRVRKGWHFYSGWFHFVGEIEEAPDDGGLSAYGRVPDCEDFTWSFQVGKRDLVPKEFYQFPVVQLDWLAVVPWLMDEEEPT